MAVRLSRLPEFLDRWQVPYVLVDGWEERSRRSGDFVDVMGVGWHHTASSTTPARDLGWMYFNTANTSRPVGNCLLDRTGLVHLASVRATNTQGKGGPRLTSRGTIPLDSGNTRTFAIEVANDGVGEEWPDVQVESYLRLTCAAIECVNETTPGAPLGAGDVFAHFEWAPGRKWDPAGPVGNWWADESAAGWSPYPMARLWDMDRARGDVFLRLLGGAPVVNPEPVPVEPGSESAPLPGNPGAESAPLPVEPGSEPPEVEDDVKFICRVGDWYYIADGLTARRVSRATAVSWLARHARAGRALRDVRSPQVEVTDIEKVPSISSNAVQSLGQLFVEPSAA